MRGKHKGLIHFSQKATLAIHAMIYLKESDRIVDASVMARDLGVSRTHLAKVISLLVGKGLAKSIRGRGGGVMLADSAKDASVLDLLKAIDEPVFGPYCLLDNPVKPGIQCAVVDVMDHMNALIIKSLSEVTLDNFRPCPFVLPGNRDKDKE